MYGVDVRDEQGLIDISSIRKMIICQAYLFTMATLNFRILRCIEEYLGNSRSCESKNRNEFSYRVACIDRRDATVERILENIV